MKIFLKHIFKTVKKAPFQPLLVLLTIILSVAVGVTAFRFGSVFFLRSEKIAEEELSLGDIIVTASSDRSNGILFDSDAKELLGDRASVLGDFSLVAFREGENGKKQPIFVSATDLCAADGFFEFDYYEYGEFNTENSYRSVIISKSYADKSGLSVGDSFKIEILNEELEYTVEAVAENSGILLKKDVLLPIDSIVRLLSERSAFIASLGNSFEPYNRLLIKCADGEAAADLAPILSGSSLMSGCRIDNIADNSGGESFALFESISTMLLALLISGLAVLLIITSQSLMQKQRATEYALFCAVGASRKQLAALQFAESTIYAVLGAIVGILISPYMLDYAVSMFSWQRYGVAVGIEGIVFGIILSFALCFIGTLVTVRRDGCTELGARLNEGNYPKPAKEGSKPVVLLGIITAFCVSAIFVCPIKYRYIPTIIAIFTFMVLLYASSGHILRSISGACEKLLLNGKKIRGVGILASKSLKNNPSLRHSGRLLCVMFSLLCAIFICSGELTRQYNAFDNIIKGELIVVNMNADTESEIKKSPYVKGVSTFCYSDAILLNGKYEVMTIFTSGDSRECLSDDFTPEKLPEGNEIVVSGSAARLMGIKCGDYISAEINGQTYSVKVIEISDVKIPIVYLDCSFASSSDLMNCIKLNDGIGVNDEAYGELVADILASGAIMIDEKEITGKVIDTLGGFTSLVFVTVVMAVVISLVGCANVFYDSVMSRKREREILCLCGMEKRRILAMQIVEACMMLLIAVAVGVICGMIVCLGLNVCLNSFGFALFG